jgi:hypothetical protein
MVYEGVSVTSGEGVRRVGAVEGIGFSVGNIVVGRREGSIVGAVGTRVGANVGLVGLRVGDTVGFVG